MIENTIVIEITKVVYTAAHKRSNLVYRKILPTGVGILRRALVKVPPLLQRELGGDQRVDPIGIAVIILKDPPGTVRRQSTGINIWETGSFIRFENVFRGSR